MEATCKVVDLKQARDKKIIETFKRKHPQLLYNIMDKLWDVAEEYEEISTYKDACCFLDDILLIASALKEGEREKRQSPVGA